MHAAVAGRQLERPQQVVSRDVQLASPVIDGGQTDIGLDLIGRYPQRFQRGSFVAVSEWLRLSGKGCEGSDWPRAAHASASIRASPIRLFIACRPRLQRGGFHGSEPDAVAPKRLPT